MMSALSITHLVIFNDCFSPKGLCFGPSYIKGQSKAKNNSNSDTWRIGVTHTFIYMRTTNLSKYLFNLTCLSFLYVFLFCSFFMAVGSQTHWTSTKTMKQVFLKQP
jgi:hypothetical protein